MPIDPRQFLSSGCLFALNPTELLIGWGGWRRTSHAHDCSIFAPDFYLTAENPWLSPAHFEVVKREEFTSILLAKLGSEVKPNRQGFQWVEPALEGFEQQAQKIREHFVKQRLEKAVPVVHAQAREIMTQDRLLAVLEKMAEAPVSLIPQGFWDFESGEGLLGATPERLFSIERQNRVNTMALAGTRAKTSSDDARLLFEDPKERHEHQLVVDDLVERLSEVGTVVVGQTETTELPTLFHLKTSITVEGVRAEFDELASLLHPTPALGVSPRSFGLENMREWDDVALRARYGAPFGLVLRTREHEIQDCLVAIRNIQWTNGLAPTLGSGCGFVKESTVPQEWSELRLKRDSVKKVLGV
jgi:menaquinone-specific isochorismate synthase